MKLAIPLVLAVLLLGFFLHQPPSAEAPAARPAPVSSSSPSDKRPSLMASRMAQQAEEQRQRREGMDEVMAKNAQAMTPRLKELLMNRLMEVRTPRYKQLFDSLQVDSATQADLLKAIRDREERLFDLHRKQRAAGMQGIKEFGADYQIERMLTDKLFGLLVGDEKAAEIIQLEAEMLGTAQKVASSLTD
ncbi:MAG: hypothetical protein ACYC67_09735 [Prosthecobacter sp.]